MTDDLAPSEAAIWRQKYNEQRKKSRLLTVATAVLAVVAVGLGIWGFTQSSDTNPTAFPGAPGQMGGYGPPSGGQMPDFGSQLFNDDGSVNTEALQQMLDRDPNGGGNIDQFLTFAQQSGQLTDAQVEKLKAAAEKLQSS